MKKFSLFMGLLMSIVMVLLSFPIAVAAADVEKFDLTLSVDGNGITFPEPGVHSYDAGAMVEISAIPDDGYQFDHWTGEVESPAPDSSVIMTADKVVTAHFVEIPPPGYMEGQVTDALSPDSPIQGARVVVYDQNEYIKASVPTDVSGGYSLDIPAGTYKVRFMKNGTYEDRWFDNAADFASAQIVQITAGSHIVVDGSLYPLNILTGNVRDFNTDLPINEGISVRAYNSGGANIASAEVTDGSFEIRLPPGSYRLNMFDISGYYQSEWYSDATSFATANTIVFSSYGEAKPPIEIQLNPVGSAVFISGTVTDAATGNGIEGITVSIYNGSEALIDSVVTGSSGSYSSDPLGTGYYTIKFSVSSGEYVTEWYDNAPGPDSAAPVSVNTGETTTANAALDRLSPTGISGTVTDAQTYSPLQGIHVELIYDNSSWAGDAYTDASGHYIIANLAPGPYYRVRFSDYSLDNYIEEWYQNSPDWENAIDVPVVAKSLTTVNAELNPWGKITGYVTDELTDTGISGIGVTVLNNESSVWTTTTDASGYWEARRLAIDTGSVYKFYFHDESGSYADEWYHNANTTNDAAIVHFTNLARVLTVDEQLSRPGTIEGVLEADYENTGSFLEGVSVYAFDLNYNYIKQATSDSHGFYRISGLLPGSYKVQFSTIYEFYGEWYHDQLNFETADAVTVAAGETITINERQTPWGTVTGQVTDSLTGNPVEDVKVEVYEGDNPSPLIYGGNTAGYYGISLSPGVKYNLCFSDFSGDYESKWYYDISVELQVAQELNLTLSPFGKITGTVTNSNGDLLYAAQVTVYDGAGAQISSGQTDFSGYYRIKGLTTGSYKIFFQYEDQQYNFTYIPEWYDNAYSMESATPVAVSAGATTNVSVMLEAYGQIYGVLLDAAKGQVITSGDISVALYDSSNNFIAYAELSTEEPGNFQIRRIKPGDYKLLFHDGTGTYQDEWWENELSWESADSVQVTERIPLEISVRLNPQTSWYTQMAIFLIKEAKIDFKKKPNDDKVKVSGILRLDQSGNIPTTQVVTITIGPLTETITMDAKGKKNEKWEYERPKNGTGDIQHVTIDWKNGVFEIHLNKAELGEATNPVTISIVVGNYIGEQTILMKEKNKKYDTWDYKAGK